MSYILEALRKAQAERERGQVPGLEARPLVDGGPAPSVASRGLSLGLAGLVVAVLIAALAWWLTTASASKPAVLAQAPPAPLTLPTSSASEAQLPIVVSAPPAVPVPRPAPAALAPLVAVPARAPASVAPTTLRLAQVTPEQRRQLPPLVVGGSMWSENAASRFVIIDGQVLREGDAVAPGLLLERIAAKSAWLRWRDLRIELTF